MKHTRMHKARMEETRMERLVLTANMAGSLLLSSGVTACAIYLLLTLASLALARPSQIDPLPLPDGV